MATKRAARRPVALPSADDVPARAEDAPGGERRKEVLSGIGRLLTEGCLRLQAEGGDAEGDTAPRDPSNDD